MSIIVTGVAGFIASSVAQLLLAEGQDVVGIDSMNSAYDVRLKRWRLEQLTTSPRFSFHQKDISDLEATRSVFASAHAAGGAVQAVINLAARAGVRYSVVNPWVYLQTNLIGTQNLLELSREYGVGKLVLASSSSVYGSNNPMPYREDSNTDRPLSPYAASKKAAEELCYSYHHLHGLDVSVLRYFTVYGPAGRPDMSPFRFVQWLSEGRPIVLYGDGNQRRDFTYVEDIARGTVAALKPLGYEVINLGSDKPVAINEMIRLLEERIGRKAELVRKQRHPADMDATWADIGKARRLLDWSPRYTFPEGLARLVEWYQANREWASTVPTAD